MGSKIYKGESMNVGNKIMENSLKLVTIEFVKTQDGVGCGMATTGGFFGTSETGWQGSRMANKSNGKQIRTCL